MSADERSRIPPAAAACSNMTQGGREVAPVERERHRRPETPAEMPRRRPSDIAAWAGAHSSGDAVRFTWTGCTQLKYLGVAGLAKGGFEWRRPIGCADHTSPFPAKFSFSSVSAPFDCLDHQSPSFP
jgi:hypothetical protein